MVDSFKALAVSLALAFSATLAHASKEGMLSFSTFAIESAGIGDSGAVKISGSQGAEGIAQLKVMAFQKEFDLNAQQLSELKGFHFNAIQASYEGQFMRDDHRVIFITLSKGFLSGTVAKKVVKVYEDGSVSIVNQ